MSRTHYVALPDSDRVPRRGARVIGPVNPRTPLTVTLYLRRDPNAPQPVDPYELALVPPTRRTVPDDTAYAEAHPGVDADLEAVEEFAGAHNLTVGTPNRLARSIQLTGATADVANAFQVTLARYRYQGRDRSWQSYRGREGAIYLPSELDGIVTAVVGLDDRPVGTNLLIRRAADGHVPLAAHVQPAVPAGAFLPPMLNAPYGYPDGTDGSGQCIAVLAFNGETSPGTPSGGFRLDALKRYFVDVLGQQMPDISTVVVPNVGSPGNDPGRDDRDADPLDATGEIMLDLAVVGALAPKAKIVVYFSKFSEQGWTDVISTVVTDTANRPDVISNSYGFAEDAAGGFGLTRMAINRIDRTLANAAGRNVSICCASGDDGSRDQIGDERAHADFPSCSPHVLGVGGTRLIAEDGVVTAESVWDDGPGSRTGGGVSMLFPVPPFQAGIDLPSVNPPFGTGRIVPDVSALADPVTGVMIMSVDGKTLVRVGGTSAAAPMWAALLARINQGLGAPVGFLNPLLYRNFSQGVLRDITTGSNGAFASGPGFDACTGLGSPGGRQLLAGLKAL
ncbi:S8 family serine peptidase [Kitasatospora sp. NPDC056138]|uniref:S53 family peptidase n=1 Tax=Kitasatospora sp. NPDC056138 TaxID=3345724 RepID=UPI0035DA468A